MYTPLVKSRGFGLSRAAAGPSPRPSAPWQTAQRAHAIPNGVFVASPNRVGHEDEPGTNGITFFGQSFVCDPFGRYVAEAGDREDVLIARCDPALLESVRRNWPFLRDRRIDAYDGLRLRYGE